MFRLTRRLESAVQPNRVLQRAGARSTGLRSRGRAPMLIGGWRGRSAPCARLPLNTKVVRCLGRKHFVVVVVVLGFSVHRSAVPAASSNGRAATGVQVSGAAATGGGLHSGRAARCSVVLFGSARRLAAAAPRTATVGCGSPAAGARAWRARPAGCPVPLAHQR